MKAERKTKNVTVRLSRSEHELLGAMAKKNHMSLSKYIRFLLSQKPMDYPEIREEIYTLINEVNHIGVNINQIVKDYNSGFYSKTEKEQLVAYLQKIEKHTREVVKKIGDM